MLAVPPSKCIKLTWVPDASLPEVNTQPADDMLALLAKVAGEVDRQPHKPLRSILKNALDTARSRDLQLRTEGPSNSPGNSSNLGNASPKVIQAATLEYSGRAKKMNQMVQSMSPRQNPPHLRILATGLSEQAIIFKNRPSDTITDVGDVDLEKAARNLSCLFQDNTTQLSRANFAFCANEE
eukprot:CAMPEP_0179407244 /NCGR_PEP_ID=MMETSP0799-20121207/1379_1 /TAXON_ID=46947 /ORGANISM="Geminigera cryophila, Strain CCMP2564" /LENGTH=181 /DNA_ID=CAMNT_0021178471 /DNA_START=44 /DNA_END=586 /DNA_ORIENTATION=+